MRGLAAVRESPRGDAHHARFPAPGPQSAPFRALVVLLAVDLPVTSLEGACQGHRHTHRSCHWYHIPPHPHPHDHPHLMFVLLNILILLISS
eukprot:2686096-Pyramimonas_sp.AAC.1